MAQRPNFINLPPRAPTASSSAHSSPAIPPSPRREYVTGDAAPALSPLDNLAAQSRALARQLEDSRKLDRRVSRLPPLTVADGLVKRAGYSATQSPASAGPSSAGFHAGPSAPSSNTSIHPNRPPPISPPSEQSGIKMHIESPTNRPASHYPRYGQPSPMRVNSAPRVESSLAERGEAHEDQRFLTPQETSSSDYFGAPRTHSPERTGLGRTSLESTSQKSSYSSMSKSKNSMDSYRNAPLSRGASIESSSSRFSHYSDQLQPPNPPYARKTPSLRSISSEDDNPGITPSSSYSQRRKLSSSSGTSLPLSPQLQYKTAHNRSTSQLSEVSMGGTRYRPSYNFSRPISRQSGRPSVDSPMRASSESNTRIYNEEDPRESMESNVSDQESMVSTKQEPEGESSYVYSKFSLPRGRVVDRESLPLEQLMPKLDVDSSHPPASPMTPPVASNDNPSTAKPARPPRRHFVEALDDDDTPMRTSTDCLPSRPPPPPIPELKYQHRHSMTSMNTSNTSNSASTIKASKQNPASTTTADLSAEKHLEKGIALHEAGSLHKSTYHLRLAAKGNNPTGMLLYALACRHGWGMRQSPSEGVSWLRKAIDLANVAMNESENSEKSPLVAQLQRTQRAQFALGVYELGVSHMNGWGVEHDKMLALRCFEIASAWGDADAMAEAGFCYYQGVGVKKDLVKAAKYYRQAEAKGVSMVGNSWIHKSKYDEKASDAEPEERAGRAEHAGGDEKKKRDKSRTRTLFGRKKSNQT